MRKLRGFAADKMKLIAAALSLSMILLTAGCGQGRVSADSASSSAGSTSAAASVTDNAASIAAEAATNAVEAASTTAERAEAIASAMAERYREEILAAEQIPTEPEEITLDPSWEFADFSEIHSGAAVLYRAAENRKDIVIGVNAGHGTEGGAGQRTYCHPDSSPKTTGGSTSAGSVTAAAVSGGTTLHDGTTEREANLRVAQELKDRLLEAGYDVLMVRDGDDVQLDNIARTVICNNLADCHIAIHFDGDGLGYDKGAFYISVPGGIKDMYPVSENWEKCDALGESLVEGLHSTGVGIYGQGNMSIDLTQTSYSTIPSVDIELGNQASDLSDESIGRYADGLLAGIEQFAAQYLQQ